MSSASPKSLSEVAPRRPAPMMSTERIGRMATSEVLSDRINTWFIDRSTIPE
jgi:hypothetical protein